jgi:hypothetical protein
MYSAMYIYCTFTRPASTIAIGSVSVTRQEANGTGREAFMTEEVKFTRGSDRINQLAQRPDIAAGVAQIRADMAEDDRHHALGLAAIAEPPASSSASPTATNPSSASGNSA